MEASGITLQMETAPGSGEYRDVAEIVELSTSFLARAPELAPECLARLHNGSTMAFSATWIPSPTGKRLTLFLPRKPVRRRFSRNSNFMLVEYGQHATLYQWFSPSQRKHIRRDAKKMLRTWSQAALAKFPRDVRKGRRVVRWA